jgi:hypothetical protein
MLMVYYVKIHVIVMRACNICFMMKSKKRMLKNGTCVKISVRV